MKQGCCWQVGNEDVIATWRDPWISSLQGIKPISNVEKLNVNHRLQDSLLNNPRRWDCDKLNNTFTPWDVVQIRKILVSDDLAEDKLMWTLTNKGDFTSKSFH
ncbi:hypothetical protein MKW92_029721, partial [Papaver armeniacum]